MRPDQLGFVALGIDAVAGPRIVARVSDHACPNRIQLDVSITAQQVELSIDKACAISAFPEPAGALVHSIYVLHVALPKILHQKRYTTLIDWSKEEMQVVCHQHVSVHGAAVFFREIGEIDEEE